MNIKLKKINGKFCKDCAIRRLFNEQDARLYKRLNEICQESNCQEDKIIFVEVK